VAALDDDDTLSTDELIANALLLYLAGHETTGSAIGVAQLTLHRNPDQLALLRRNLNDTDLLRSATEEVMRWDHVATIAFRVATESATFGETEIPTGSGIFVSIGSANRDPDIFDDPDTLNIRRKVIHTNMFGGGAHTCLGQALARQEVTVSIEGLLRRLPRMKLDTLEPPWRPDTFMRGLEALPVSW
jgi:cytochrome P450